MSLPLNVVERLFERLTATYGREWIGKWEGTDITSVKSLWAHELAPYADRLDAIAWALENLTSKCPNAIEFKALCRQAPQIPTGLLTASKADYTVVAEQLAKIGKTVGVKVDDSNRDHKAWAKRLKARHDKGEKLNLVQITSYRKALDIREGA